MLPEYFAVISALIASIGGFIYLYETLQGTAKPNRITWLLWGILPVITFVAQRIQGVTGVSWITFASGFTPLLIFAASFANKKSYWKTERADYICMAVAFLGLLLWAITSTPNLAIVFSIVADFAAGLPTLIKSFKHPETESWQAYAVSAFGFGVGVLSIHSWTFANYSFVSYLLLNETVMAVFSVRKAEKVRSAKL